MRDMCRIPVLLDAIHNYWIRHPDLRFGQIVSIIEAKVGEEYRAKGLNPPADIFYIEDDKIKEIIDGLNADEPRYAKL